MIEWFQKQRVGDLPRRAAERFGTRGALVGDGRRWTFIEFEAEVEQLSRGLIGAGVGHGDRVAVWMTNRVEWIFLVFALARIGAVLVPAQSRYRTVDVVYAIRQSGASTLVLIDRSGPVNLLAMLREAFGDLGAQEPDRLSLPAAPDLRRIVLLAPESVPGTLSWDAVTAQATGCDDGAVRARYALVDPTTRCLLPIPPALPGHRRASSWSLLRTLRRRRRGPARHHRARHDFELPAVVSSLLVQRVRADVGDHWRSPGASRHFEAEAALDLIEQEHVTVIHGFDAHYRDLMVSQERRPRDLSSLRLERSRPVCRIPPQPRRARSRRSVHGLGVRYDRVLDLPDAVVPRLDAGAASRGLRLSDAGIRHPGRRPGHRRAGTRRHVRRDPRPRLHGDAGNFIDRRRPRQALPSRATSAAATAGSFAPTGTCSSSVGTRTCSRSVARMWPRPVEAFLLQIPGVRDVAVVGLPDDRLQEVPVAYLVCAPDAAVSTADVAAHCRQRIASFKIPRHVTVLDTLPMTPTGKVQKHLLRERALREFAAGPPAGATAPTRPV